MLRMGRQGSACKGSYDLCGMQWHQGPALRSTIAEMKPRTHHRTLQVTEMRLGNGNGMCQGSATACETVLFKFRTPRTRTATAKAKMERLIPQERDTTR